jgi:hypothetical protein
MATGFFSMFEAEKTKVRIRSRRAAAKTTILVWVVVCSYPKRRHLLLGY